MTPDKALVARVIEDKEEQIIPEMMPFPKEQAIFGIPVVSSRFLANGQAVVERGRAGMERSPMMDALYDVGLMTPSINWRVESVQTRGGTILLRVFQGPNEARRLVTDAEAWGLSREEWVWVLKLLAGWDLRSLR